jgi:hypothetical protein
LYCLKLVSRVMHIQGCGYELQATLEWIAPKDLYDDICSYFGNYFDLALSISGTVSILGWELTRKQKRWKQEIYSHEGIILDGSK